MKQTFRIVASVALLFMSVACAKEQQQSPSMADNGDEISTLTFGLPENQSLKTSFQMGTSGIKLTWQEGDLIVVKKGENSYNYKLESVDPDTGIGTFKAVGKGIPNLAGNTENVAIFHFGKDNQYPSQYASVDQDGSGSVAHLNENCILQRVTSVPPVSVEDLEGVLEGVNSVMNFKIAYPECGLGEGENPTSFIFTVKSWNASFISYPSGTASGISLSPSSNGALMKKIQVRLPDNQEWSVSEPLDIYFNLLMNSSDVSSSDQWIFEVQTNTGAIYTVTKDIKKKPEYGKYYSAEVSGLVKETNFPASPVGVDFKDYVNATLTAYYQSSPSCEEYYTYLHPLYNNIEIYDKDGNFVMESYVEGGKGGGGKGDAFMGEGSISTNLYPGKTYKFRPVVVVEGDISYYGEWKEFTVPSFTVCTDKEVDLGLDILWAGWNVDASAPEEIGGYYAWGETSPVTDADYPGYKFYYIYNYSKYLTKYVTEGSHAKDASVVDAEKDTLDSEDDVASVKWDDGWRMPKRSDVAALYELTSLTDYVYNGVTGVVFIGNDNVMFIPYGGYYDNGIKETNYAFLWTSSLCTAASGATRAEYIDYGAYVMQTKNAETGSVYFIWPWKNDDIAAARHGGRNIRPVKDKPTT